MSLPDPSILLLSVPVVSLLAYVPLVCLLDLEYREVEHWYWIPLVLVNIPTMVMMMSDSNYLLYLPSLVAIFVWFTAMRFHYFEGADFLYLTWISLFYIYNPRSGHWLMVLPFTIFLAACLIVTAGWILAYNLFTGKGLTLKFDKEIPMMFPISAALLLTVLLA
jgi:hypothetical protein